MQQLLATHALTPEGWQPDVLLEWDSSGTLTKVQPRSADTQAPRTDDIVIPAIPNLHSHAFQRAIAGLTESRSSASATDSFWTWRTLMYRFADQLTPELLEAVATAVYVEMLETGYGSVCEFHYVHHQPGGAPYAPADAMAQAIVRAAQKTGIGLTLLPVLYQSAGFGNQPPQPHQRRFLHEQVDDVLRLVDGLRGGTRTGLAPHSLRAVPPDALREAVAGLHAMDPSAPIHIHIAEQQQEVDDCLAHTGARPVQWLLDHAEVDARWCLVHATHLDDAEVRRAATTGAVAGLCPSTEMNLGDGTFRLWDWQGEGQAGTASGAWGIGSDSHVCVSAAEELMLLEYSQRLAHRQRNVAATAHQPHTGTALWLGAVAGGAQAAGRPVAGLADGQQADFIELNALHPALHGLPPALQLDAHVFASHRTSAIRRVHTAGRVRVQDGRHPLAGAAQAALAAARHQLLQA